MNERPSVYIMKWRLTSNSRHPAVFHTRSDSIFLLYAHWRERVANDDGKHNAQPIINSSLVIEVCRAFFKHLDAMRIVRCEVLRVDIDWSASK